ESLPILDQSRLNELLQVVVPRTREVSPRLGDGFGKGCKSRQRRLHEFFGFLPAEHVGRALHPTIDESEGGGKSRPGAHELERDGGAPGMPDNSWLLEPELADYKRRVLQQLVHRISVGQSWSMWWPSGQTVPTLVESDQAAGGQMAREAVPVVRVGAQAVEQKHGRASSRAGFGAPIEVMK